MTLRHTLLLAPLLYPILAGGCSVNGSLPDEKTTSATNKMPIPDFDVEDKEDVDPPWKHLVPTADLIRGMKKVDFKPSTADGKELTEAIPEASVEMYDTPVKNQGSRGWCTAFAQVGAIENIIKHATGVVEDLSEIDHWMHYQQYSCEASADAAAKYLIVPESSYPYYGSPIAGYKSSALAKTVDYRELGSRSEVFASIRAGKPVIIGADLTDSWQSAGSDGKVSSHGYIIGGHAILIVGYKDDPSWPGGGYIRIKNSWGGKWGNLGYAKMPYDYCNSNDCSFLEMSSVQYKGTVYEAAAPPKPPAPPDADAGPPTPAPDAGPPPSPSGEATAYDLDVEALHDPANPARFKLHLVEKKAGAMAQVAQVTYDTHETFGKYEFWTVDDASGGFAVPFYYKTYAHYWRTNGAVVRLKSGTVLRLAGAIVSF
ncbi:MAG: C1 family peptidase [Polyangiales bacterium]